MQHFPASFLGDAVRIVQEQVPNLAMEMVVEYYPPPVYRSMYNNTNRIFCYQFFDTTGKNCATFIPDLTTVNVFNPRVWGLAKKHIQSLTRFLTKCEN